MLNETMIDEVAGKIGELGLTDEAVARLRTEYEGCHFSLCFEDDINAAAKAYRECDGFNLYLVDSRDHCSVLTNDEAIASGIVIAEILD